MPERHQTGSTLAGWAALALLGLTEVAVAAACALALLQPAGAQGGIDERFPSLENRQRRYQQQWAPQWNQPAPSPFGGFQERQQQQAPVESSRAPAPRRPDVAPTMNVMVLGDSLADWLAYGLEEAFAETPELGIVRKPRANTGLIRVETRGESYDWPAAARDLLNAEKPDFVVVMLGIADRRGIREMIRQQPARPPAGQKQDQAKQAQGQAQGQPPAAQPAQPAAPAPAATPPAAAAAKPVDPEAPPPQQEAAQDQDQSSVAATEGPVAGTVVHEFRSEKWGELYARRVDEMIGVLKQKGLPVFWVGLPPVRGTRATSDAVYLNDIYRGRAEKAGIVYVDVWDGFVDDAGNFSNYGADFEGQTRRLRTGDGLHFTRAGARKLAHYLEREIRRVMLARATPLATPAPEPEPEAKEPPAAAAPGLPPRPIASPVMSLTAPRGAGDALLGGAQAQSAGADSVATRVLVKGQAIEAPAGRADDFAWPRRDIVTATGVLPPDPVEPPPKVEPAVEASGGPATTAPTKQASTPRRERRAEQPSGWQPWGGRQSSGGQTSGGQTWGGQTWGGQTWAQQQREQQQRYYEQRQRWSPPSFFGGWFGR
jgi:hypothetical protein